MFFGFPKWKDSNEAFDGVLRKGCVLAAMEYKGGFLSQEAKYSGRLDAFTADLDRKIGQGCRQLVSKLEAAFHRSKSRRKQLEAVPLEGVDRILPILIIQDQTLRGPFVNWWLNRLFQDQLARAQISNAVQILPLNVISIHEVESLLASSGAGEFDFVYALHHRTVRDPGMLSNPHDFFFSIAGYGETHSQLWEDLQAIVWEEIGSYLFPDRWKPLDQQWKPEL